MSLPTNRSTSTSIADHVADHNTLHGQHNELEGHAADTTSVHGIADTSALALDTHDHDADYEASGAVAAHTGDTSDAHDASAVSFAPAGGIAATDVQAAIVELDTEKSGTGHAHSGAYVAVADLDAKGDLIVATGNDAYDNLPVGTDGHVLTADAAETMGVKWAAAAGGSAIAEGRLYTSFANLTLPGVSVVSSGTQAFNANTLHYFPIVVPTSVTADQIKLEVTTGGAASTVARMGIYEADTNWQPGTRILDSGTVAVDSTGVKTASISQVLSAGRYLLAYHSDGAPTLRIVRGSVSGIGVSSALGGSPLLSQLTKATAYSALGTPGTAWDTTVFGSTPMQYPVFLRLSAA